MKPQVVGLFKDSNHNFSKLPCDQLTLIENFGVEGDAHYGKTVQHRSRVARNPNSPNLRQVHLFELEMLEILENQGFNVSSGILGENITTKNLDLLALPTNSLLTIGCDAVVQVTGLRNPCAQLDNFQKGLTAAVLEKNNDGSLIRKAGIMAIVLKSGQISMYDEISVQLPPQPYLPLDRV